MGAWYGFMYILSQSYVFITTVIFVTEDISSFFNYITELRRYRRSIMVKSKEESVILLYVSYYVNCCLMLHEAIAETMANICR
jgi:hypothetical protein